MPRVPSSEISFTWLYYHNDKLVWVYQAQPTKGPLPGPASTVESQGTGRTSKIKTEAVTQGQHSWKSVDGRGTCLLLCSGKQQEVIEKPTAISHTPSRFLSQKPAKDIRADLAIHRPCVTKAILLLMAYRLRLECNQSFPIQLEILALAVPLLYEFQERLLVLWCNSNENLGNAVARIGVQSDSGLDITLYLQVSRCVAVSASLADAQDDSLNYV